MKEVRPNPIAESGEKPIVAILGRPNVGKSALFNRLTGRRQSIVADIPGVTRDRIYGDCDWGGRTMSVVDTGGMDPEDPDLLRQHVFAQARVAWLKAATDLFGAGSPEVKTVAQAADAVGIAGPSAAPGSGELLA